MSFGFRIAATSDYTAESDRNDNAGGAAAEVLARTGHITGDHRGVPYSFARIGTAYQELF
jgi:hypothetical protein